MRSFRQKPKAFTTLYWENLNYFNTRKLLDDARKEIFKLEVYYIYNMFLAIFLKALFNK